MVMIGTGSTDILAGEARLAVMTSNDSAPYKETLEGCQQYLENHGIPRKSLDIYQLNGSSSSATEAINQIEKNDYRILITLGTLATETAVARRLHIPVIAGMIMHSQEIKKSGNTTGVVLSFPIETQFKMLHDILPGARTIGVLYNPAENQEIINIAAQLSRQMGLQLVARQVRTPQDIPSALDALAKKVDVLWGLPDDIVMTGETAKHILLFSYRNRIPLIGLSSPWVKAGALYALDRDYRDIGVQCGEQVIKLLQGASASSLPPLPPRKILYTVNLKTAAHMKVSISETIISRADKVYKENE